MNAFFHHDSMEGVNGSHALKLFDSVKGFMGTDSLEPSPSKLSSKGRSKRKKISGSETEVLAAPLSFMEGSTPQQTNGYDCGLYVMAIARIICQRHAKTSKGSIESWFSAIEKHVTPSVEMTMRSEVMGLIQDLRNKD
ncbi:NEDD8-specific protease 1-like [Malania oleifera]|uniref:NEDD8-specific protease 1-like n=1 Tax=Malania oleifera TaxID=397392 RepID=UPI0025AE8338|nr:NEDD8-specific protease 1-like [Malania oleifera]